MAPQATGVLLTWKRLDNLERIAGGMLAEPAVRELIVWVNRSIRTTLDMRQRILAAFPDRVCDIHVASHGTNLGTFGRYIAASNASHPVILTCDDDCHVRNWRDLLRRHLATGRIAFNLDLGHYRNRQAYTHRFNGGTCYKGLVGWGAVFSRDHLAAFDRYLAKFGCDELLQSKADRLFTMLQAAEHEIVRVQVEHLPGAKDPAIAVYRQPGHWANVVRARQRALEIMEDSAGP